jgi:predicted lactoylglutathione lyase
MGTARTRRLLHQTGRIDGTAAPCLRGARSRTVDAFHTAALDAGGTNNGAPGLRPHYHETYYSSYVIDLDGHNVEAVCHAPEH